MSIKGITQEMYVGKEEINILTFMANKITLPFSDMKRIDYCYATTWKHGYMNFVMKNNDLTKFSFGGMANDPIARTINFVMQHYPSLDMREYEQGEIEKDRAVKIIPVFGHKELGLADGGFVIRQKPTGEVYFNDDTRVFYSIVNYEWDGPEFDQVTKSRSSTNTSSNTVSDTVKKGKALKVGAGALIGYAAGPVGALIGAGMGAASKGKSRTTSKTTGNSLTDGLQTTSNVEKLTNAIIVFRNLDNGKTYTVSFKCNRDMDVKIRCFDFEQTPVELEDVVKETTTSLEGIKALKELLDMGAITQDEFDAKKKQILGL